MSSLRKAVRFRNHWGGFFFFSAASCFLPLQDSSTWEVGWLLSDVCMGAESKQAEGGMSPFQPLHFGIGGGKRTPEETEPPPPPSTRLLFLVFTLPPFVCPSPVCAYTFTRSWFCMCQKKISSFS